MPTVDNKMNRAKEQLNTKQKELVEAAKKASVIQKEVMLKVYVQFFQKPITDEEITVLHGAIKHEGTHSAQRKVWETDLARCSIKQDRYNHVRKYIDNVRAKDVGNIHLLNREIHDEMYGTNGLVHNLRGTFDPGDISALENFKCENAVKEAMFDGMFDSVVEHDSHLKSLLIAMRDYVVKASSARSKGQAFKIELSEMWIKVMVGLASWRTLFSSKDEVDAAVLKSELLSETKQMDEVIERFNVEKVGGTDFKQSPVSSTVWNSIVNDDKCNWNSIVRSVVSYMEVHIDQAVKARGYKNARTIKTAIEKFITNTPDSVELKSQRKLLHTMDGKLVLNPSAFTRRKSQKRSSVFMSSTPVKSMSGIDGIKQLKEIMEKRYNEIRMGFEDGGEAQRIYYTKKLIEQFEHVVVLAENFAERLYCVDVILAQLSGYSATEIYGIFKEKHLDFFADYCTKIQFDENSRAKKGLYSNVSQPDYEKLKSEVEAVSYMHIAIGKINMLYKARLDKKDLNDAKAQAYKLIEDAYKRMLSGNEGEEGCLLDSVCQFTSSSEVLELEEFYKKAEKVLNDAVNNLNGHDVKRLERYRVDMDNLKKGQTRKTSLYDSGLDDKEMRSSLHEILVNTSSGTDSDDEKTTDLLKVSAPGGKVEITEGGNKSKEKDCLPPPPPSKCPGVVNTGDQKKPPLPPPLPPTKANPPPHSPGKVSGTSANNTAQKPFLSQIREFDKRKLSAKKDVPEEKKGNDKNNLLESIRNFRPKDLKKTKDQGLPSGNTGGQLVGNRKGAESKPSTTSLSARIVQLPPVKERKGSTDAWSDEERGDVKDTARIFKKAPSSKAGTLEEKIRQRRACIDGPGN